MRTDLVLSALAAGYLLGSISFARVAARLAAAKPDLSQLKIPLAGSDEALPVGLYGANAASMVLGPRVGGVVSLLDALKVFAPSLVYKVLFPGETYFLCVAVAGLAGHNWPLYHRFRGGRGFAAILGGLLVADWLAVPATVATSLMLGLVVLGNPFVAYIGWLPMLIPWLWLRSHDPNYVAYAVALNAVFAVATIPEVRTAIRYRRAGKHEAYMQAMLASSPRWRGMARLTERLWLFRKH